MHDQVAGFVEGAFLEVLANYAFLFGDRVDTASLVADEDTDFIHAWIDILSNDKSHLGVVVPMELARAISANVLGVDNEDPLAHDRAEDAVKEMINVLCGHLRTLLTHEGGLFEAAIPCIQRISVLEWIKIRNSKDSLAFMIEENPLLLILSMEGQER
jgi:chemotaxis protein CheY-P-specific phosphatase CheC